MNSRYFHSLLWFGKCSFLKCIITMASLLSISKFQSRVSSVLNKDIQQYGKSYMFDSNDETCWCSDQGTPQWVAVAFSSAVEVDCIQIQFQGGFVGKDCQIIVTRDDEMKEVTDIYPEDVNTLQTFKLNSRTRCKKLTRVFLIWSEEGKITKFH